MIFILGMRVIIAIASGTGMAPIRAILLHLANNGMKRKVTCFFCARAEKDFFLTEELRALEHLYKNFKYIPVLSSSEINSLFKGEVGPITEVVDKYVDSKSNKEFYLCGPPSVVNLAINALQKNGVRGEDIFSNKF